MPPPPQFDFIRAVILFLEVPQGKIRFHTYRNLVSGMFHQAKLDFIRTVILFLECSTRQD